MEFQNNITDFVSGKIGGITSIAEASGEIVYADDKYFGSPSFIASRRMLEASGVKVRQIKDIKININED